MYVSLDPDKIIKSSAGLLGRIEDTFLASGLKKVCLELLEIAVNSRKTAYQITKPHIPLRIAISIVIISFIAGSIWLWMDSHLEFKKTAFTEFIQTFEAFLNIIVFCGIALLTLITTGTRIKRRYALKAFHQLRALAHVIDMHQLTKDPQIILIDPKVTQSTPTDTMTSYELLRYLDFCCDMLSLIAKMAALYIQNFDDPVVLSSVNDVESLTTGLSTKIWQKIQIIRID
jgi:hypothetical protein